MAQQQLVLVCHVLATQLQWPDGQFQQCQLRGNASEGTLFQGLDGPTCRHSKFSMLLKMINPDAAVDQDPPIPTNPLRRHHLSPPSFTYPHPPPHTPRS